MDIKNMTEDEVVCVMEQIKEICDETHACDKCIFYKIYYTHPTQVCPFNQTPFRWDFRKEVKND